VILGMTYGDSMKPCVQQEDGDDDLVPEGGGGAFVFQ